MFEIMSDSEVLPHQLEFVKHWSNVYFRPISACEQLREAPVHWRIFCSEKGQLAGHVAITELPVEVDGVATKLAAIGGLFVVREQMNCGFGTQLMAAAEELAFGKMKLTTAILFCLPQLVTFYKQRNWRTVDTAVTLQQPSGEIAEWSEKVMVLPAPRSEWQAGSIHVV